MAHYYVNQKPQWNGDHEVHKAGCHVLPPIQSRTYLGEHEDCHSALQSAEHFYGQVNGCSECSRECHRG